MSKFAASLMVLVLLCFLTVASGGQQIPGSISGTVLDVNGGVVAGAQVTMIATDHASSRVILSDDQGGFSFPALAPGRYTFTVTSPGLETYSSSELALHPDEKLIVPEFRLSPAATTTDVQVVVTQIELATEQLKAQEQQRAWAFSLTFTVAISGTRPLCLPGKSISLPCALLWIHLRL